jgi:YeeE/YedE family (DUF395).
MTAFTPLSAAIGGALIGAAAVLLMAGLCRIAGISGIAGGLFSAPKSDRGWRWAFLAGLALAPLLVWLVRGQEPAFELEASWTILAFAGLLVGFSTRLGSGCTSGHGVCGISRWSPRSIAATAAFMATGMATVALARLLAEQIR